MKKISRLMGLALTVAASAFLLTSCGDDEEEDYDDQPQPSQLEALSSKIDGLGNAIDSLSEKLDSLKSRTSPVPNSIDINPAPEVKQVDVTVVVPINSSSLNYFDYVIRYSDNWGDDFRDTVSNIADGIVVEDWENGGLFEVSSTRKRNPLGQDGGSYYTRSIALASSNIADGIVVEDWQDGGSYEVSLTEDRNPFGQYGGSYYTRSIALASLPVLCKVSVEMIPKMDCLSVVSFYFNIPKPYIFSRIITSSHNSGSDPSRSVGESVPVLIESMSISEFQSQYGTYFFSSCSIKNEGDGYAFSYY